jgi:alpha-mannosidase
LVSKTFVIDVLGYPESCFQPLTKVEEAGGTGVTGHKLIPQGAISLTWYHSNSTRVFRDMRFLISEHPMYDLIIGSQSIHQNRILDVPNLMDGEHNVPNKEKGCKLASSQLFIPASINKLTAEKLEELRDIMNERKTEYAPIQRKVEGPKKSKDLKILNQYQSLKQKYEIAVQNFNAENRRFQIDRYWNKHKEVKGRNEKLEELRNEWQKDFPGEEIPARVLTNPKATKGD